MQKSADDKNFSVSPYLIIVTPAKNEALRISKLSHSLNLLNYPFPVTWIIVDDSSSDGSATIIKNLSGFKPEFHLTARTSGKLILGGAFKAWDVGVQFAKKNLSNFTHLMKLDADVELDKFYFDTLRVHMQESSNGLIGGILRNNNREQSIHVPGPVKLYSRAALEALSPLPLETGYDVMDEILLKEKGFEIKVVHEAKFSINRSIGASQGLIHGRRRNGLVCKWTGYYFPYFILHASRYIFKKPFIVGSVAMIYGYFRAAPSPYSNELRLLHASHQKNLLSRIAKHPFRELTSLYFAN